MQPEVARFLLFSAQQQAQPEAAAGLNAQLHALQLSCALQAEAAQLPHPSSSQLLCALQADCARALAVAGASQQAADARDARRAAATAAVGQFGLQTPSQGSLADVLLPDVAGRQLLDQAHQAQQLMAQAGSVLQRMVADKAARAAHGQAVQHAGAGLHSAQGGERLRQRAISVPTQDRKRNLDGAAKGAAPPPPQQQTQQQQQAGGASTDAAAAAAAARWGRDGGFTSAKRHAAAAGAHDPIEVDDSSGDDGGACDGVTGDRRRQQQQQHRGGGGSGPKQQRGAAGSTPAAAAAAAGGSAGFGGAAGGAAGSGSGQQPGGRPGFQSARVQLVSDLRKKGQHQQASMFANQNAPRAGLTRPRGAAGGGGDAGGGVGGRSGFVPPFVAKACEHHTGGQQGAGPAGGGEEGAAVGPHTGDAGSAPDGELPPELAKHDPKLIEAVCNEVIDGSGGVSWDDIAGLATAKHLIREIVVWPMLNPHLFTGPRAPPKGILLFGPPGTGKTLIGKAVASNIRASFFSISASSLTSKWIGEGEKMVKTLFAVAGVMQPSVIFIDEIDSIMSARKSDGEHESSRRLKTELLVQMEGCDPASTERRVLLVGATNRPEELDEAARRRLPKQLYIPLPCAEARRAMILRQLGPGCKVAASLSDADLDKVVAKTDGYSGSDMRNLIQEACQGPVRAAVAAHGEAVASLCDADLRPVVLRDFQHAAKAQRASVTPSEIERYEAYNARHGAQYVGAGAGGGDADGGDGDGAEDEDDW